jgi:hypothetical protein
VVFHHSSEVLSSLPPHEVQHFIKTVSQTATAKFRRYSLDSARLAAAEAEFQAMLNEGIIRCSSSQ